MSEARQSLWRQARAWSDAAGAELSPRMRRWTVRDDPPLAFELLAATPAWIASSQAERSRLARLTGAVLVSRGWSRAISGAVLGRAAEAVGEEALDALINLPEVVTPEAVDLNAASGDPVALDRLGAGALIAAAGARGAARARLARLFPAGAGVTSDQAAALTAQRTAEGVALAVSSATPAAS